MSVIGKRIKHLREQHGYSQEELGKRLGVTKSAVHKMENDPNIDLRASKILALSEIFNVYPRLFIYEDEKRIVDLFIEYTNDERMNLAKGIEATRIERAAQVLSHESPGNPSKFGTELMKIIDTIFTLNGEGVERVRDYVNDMSQVERYRRKFSSNLWSLDCSDKQ